MTKNDVDFESRLVPLMLAYARERGVDPRPLVDKYRVPSDVLAQPPAKVTLTTAASVLPSLADELASTLGDAHLGLSMAAWLPKGLYGVAEFLMRAGPTLRQSFENLIRFNAILAPNQSFRFEVGETSAQYHNTSLPLPNLIGRHLQEYSCALVIKTLVALSPGTAPGRVWFSHARPTTMEFERLVAAVHCSQLEFDAATNGFEIGLEALDAPVVGGDAALYAFLEEHAVAALGSRPKSDDLIEKLRHLLRDAIKQGEPNVERLATRLNMSGRTLQRRLADMQTSFQEVLDHLRFDLARAYLKDVRLDVSQIAYLLGYSELRAFDRAFRRWADKSPTEWRAAS